VTDVHLWWYISRASALIAWALMTLSVVWGILLSTRILRKVDNPGWLADLHKYLGGMTLVLVGLHMVSLMLDGWLRFGVSDVLVPFSTNFKSLPVALGILAFYVLIAVQGSSMMMNRLPRKFWKGLHYASYATLILVSFHAGFTGTDVGSWWYQALSISLIVIALISVLLRIVLAPTIEKRAGRADAGQAPATSPLPAESIQMIVTSVLVEADGILGIRLAAVSGQQLPVWQPGAHITLHLPNGLERQYSLCGENADRAHFDIAVLRTADSQGGSSWIHEFLAPGMVIPVSGPRNHFELEPAADYLFIAGGIGITPIMGMIESLPPRREWHLLYFGRSLESMAFAGQLRERYPDRVTIVLRGEARDASDLASLIGDSSANVYCCGPEGLMQAVSAIVPRERLSLERFVAIERQGPAVAVTVTAVKSGKRFIVPAEQSILEALESNALPILGSCRKGVCGNCEVRVVSGTPDHRDSVLEDAEKDSLRIMYPCVSRASTPELILDI
jgi:ferredoxin-NADP reductase/DMSO/TMAO reductase YedYZ heme-binding membrane subunit